jgi:hypothetical protein
MFLDTRPAFNKRALLAKLGLRNIPKGSAARVTPATQVWHAFIERFAQDTPKVRIKVAQGNLLYHCEGRESLSIQMGEYAPEAYANHLHDLARDNCVKIYTMGYHLGMSQKKWRNNIERGKPLRIYYFIRIIELFATHYNIVLTPPSV